MTAETDLRDKLARIDALRRDAQIAEQMHSHWMGHNGELVTVTSVIVRRRWRGEKTVHTEIVMTTDEREIFRDFLVQRKRRKTEEANALAATLVPASTTGSAQ